jgi:hypothetical protein
VWFVAVDPHGYAQPVAPDALGEFRHVTLAAEESPFAVLRIQEEPFEVAEAIEDETSDLSGKGFMLFGRMLPPAIAGG